MQKSYVAEELPIRDNLINQEYFMNELIDATSKLEVYKSKVKDSKVDSSWFLPTLQQKEALDSSKLEGTQATLDGVLINQVAPNEKDKNLNEVDNYYTATVTGYNYLYTQPFTNEFFYIIHKELMAGNVRKPSLIGKYRETQNYIGMNDGSHAIIYVPPEAKYVPSLMNNLIQYMNEKSDKYRPLVQTAIIHAQFETIHPFLDGNGRVGRMLIPMYLYAQHQIELPCFFISEALESDKIRYYTLLNNIRFKHDWNEWIRFFLNKVTQQCDKYIHIIENINSLYDTHMKIACDLSRSSNMVDIIDSLYKHPVTNVKRLEKDTGISSANINRYLNLLVDNKILYTDGKSRNRTYFYLDLIDIIR